MQIQKKKVMGIERSELVVTNNFQLLFLNLLREYIDLEFSELKEELKEDYSLERVIDDLVFFCFFIGNDFLPSLITLDIADASIDMLIDMYKE